MLGWLDRRSPQVQHLLVTLAVALLAWGAQDGLPTVSPWLDAHPPLGPLAAAAAAQLLLWLTPIVRSYGAGKGDAQGRHEAGVIELRVSLQLLVAVVTAAALVALCLAAIHADAAPRGGTVPASSPRPAPSPVQLPQVHVQGSTDDVVLAAAVGSSSSSSAFRYTGLEHVRTSSAAACERTLLVSWDSERLVGRTWRAELDHGDPVTLQVHDAAGRWGPYGAWRDVPSTSGGEHMLRWAGYGEDGDHGAQLDLVRVVLHGRRSSPLPITDGCPA
jgi:hypothetical protein